MIISPLPYRKHVRRTPLGVMSASGRIEGETGGIVFCDSAQPLLRMARSRGGIGVMIRGRTSTRWLRFEIDGTTYYPGIPSPRLGEVLALSDFARERGVRMSSLPSMASSMYRSTLGGYMHVADAWESMPWRTFPPGARLHARPGVYDSAVSVDLRSAYLWATSTLQIPKEYVECRAKLGEILETPGSFAIASVKLRKDVPYGPVPCISSEGTTTFPTRRERYESEVLLSGEDLRIAAMMGDVRIRRAWVGVRMVSPFTSFMGLAIEMREAAGDLGKQTANTLWGTFAAGAQTAVVEFVPGRKRNRIRNMAARTPLCFPIAATVLARIRAKVYLEAVGESAVHVHTDGVISAGSMNHLQYGNRPGEWRVVGNYRSVEILAPGWYAYTTESGESKVKAAGRSGGEATRRAFAHRRETWLSETSSLSAGLLTLGQRVDAGTI